MPTGADLALTRPRKIRLRFSPWITAEAVPNWRRGSRVSDSPLGASRCHNHTFAMKFILVTGTTFALPLPGYRPFRRAADMAGRALARAGFGLVSGNPPGVDSVASEAFWAECRRLGRAPQEAYRQLWLPQLLRGYWLPGEGFPAPQACIERLTSTREWIERAITLAGAAVMIGGRGGALGIAERFIDAGKPVLPIPFVGGESRPVFDAILRTWDMAPVPGLTQNQFLRLAIPWISDTGVLTKLLLGTLAATADVFVSYRRSDTALAAGRIHGDLLDQFGKERIFMDLHGIPPSAEWLATIDAAVAASRIGIVIIGPDWLAPAAGGRLRLSDPDDIVRRELRGLLDGDKRLLPVLVAGAQLPPPEALPEDLWRLKEYQAIAIDNTNWPTAMKQIVAAIDTEIGAPARSV